MSKIHSESKSQPAGGKKAPKGRDFPSKVDGASKGAQKTHSWDNETWYKLLFCACLYYWRVGFQIKCY